MKVVITEEGLAFPLPPASQEEDWIKQGHVVIEAEEPPTDVEEIHTLFMQGREQ